MHTKQILTSTTLAALLALCVTPSTGLAKDTDVYLKTQTDAVTGQPNVMIIFDTSGSMDTYVNTRVPYDPAHNYCNESGAPASNVCNGTTAYDRIFWGLSGVPSASTNDWAATSKNKCLDSTSSLSTAGYYSGNSSKIAGWRSGGSYGWKALSNNAYDDDALTYIDCEADGVTVTNTTADGLAADDGNYALATTSSPAYNTSGTAFAWGSFGSDSRPTLYTANYMAYYRNTDYTNTNIYLAHRTRINIAKDAVKTIVDANKNIRFGLMIFNDNASTGPHGGRVVMKIDTMDDARRTAMKSIVDGLVADGSTPLAETMWEAYRYFAGLSVQYGDDTAVRNVTSLTRSGTTVTVTTSTNHQYVDGHTVVISGATQSEYNGTFTVTYVDSDTFTYEITGAPASPGTGTITSTVYRDLTAEVSGVYDDPYALSCQKAYIIYMTDGDPTSDGNADTSIKGLPGMSGNTCAFDSSDATTDCLKDLAQWMRNNDVNNPGVTGTQVVTTFTIGFGDGISADGKALLETTAQNGGGTYQSAEDSDQLVDAFESALSKVVEETASFASPSLSVNAFNRLYNRDDVYFALFKPSPTIAWEGNVKKYKLCNHTDAAASKCTFGDVVYESGSALPNAIVTTTDPVTGKPVPKIDDAAISYWSGATADGSDVLKGGAGINIPAPASRTLYTYLGSYSGLSASSPAMVLAITNTSGGTFHDTAINDPTILGLTDTSGSAADTNATDTDNAEKLINWMRGYAYGSTTTTRWGFNDTIHSRPVAISYGAVTDILGTPDPNNPIIKLFVGTNEGAIRMINSSTGAEEWAFIPKEMLTSQHVLRQDADAEHTYGLDNSPTFWIIDVNKDGIIDPAAGDKVYMYVSMRRGGNNIYAFDVTPASKLTSQSGTVTPKLMWVIEGGSGDYAQLGQTWSRPLVARIRAACSGSVCDDGDSSTDDSASRAVLIFAGGYDTNQDNAIPAGPDSVGNAIYIVNPLTGERIIWISNTGATVNPGDMQYSIPSDIGMLDSDADGSVDRLYVGDTGGQIWRIDLGATVATDDAGGTVAYVFADAVCARNTTTNVRDCSAVTAQDWRKFFYPPDISQIKDNIYSSSQFYDLVTIGSGDREDPLDLLTTNLTAPSSRVAVNNRIYAIRDYNYKTGSPSTTPIALVGGDLYDQTTNLLGTSTGSDLTDEITILQGKKGWYMDLKESSSINLPNGLTSVWVGEKVLARTVIFAGELRVTTFVPANDTTATVSCQPNEGEAREYVLNYLTGTALYDFDNDGTGDRMVAVGSGIPSETVIVIREGGITGLVGTSGGASSRQVGGGKGVSRIHWYDSQ